MIKTKPTDSPIVKRLKTQERAQLKLLGEYSKILDRTAQIITGLKVEVEWSGVRRYSTTSNFAMFTGRGTVRKGEKIEGNLLEQDYVLPVSMTLLLDMLDDGSTPYQLAEVSQLIVNVRQVLGPEDFHEFLKDETSDLEKIHALLPKLQETTDDNETSNTEQSEGKEPPKPIATPVTDLPGRLSGIDTTGLNADQKQSYSLSYLVNYIKAH